MEDASDLAEALGRARPGHQARIRELLQSSPRRAHALLRSSIRSGLINDSDRIDENALIGSMMMTRNTIRGALAQLGEEGLLQRRQRVGTNIVGGIFEIPLMRLTTLGSSQADVHPQESRIEWTTLEISEVIAPEHIRRRLGESMKRVVLREALVEIGGSPMGVVFGYYPIAPATAGGPLPDISEYIAALKRSPSSQYEVTVEAINADERTARLLGTREGAALLSRETLVSDANGTPRSLSYGHFRGDRVSLFAADSDVGEQPID